MNKNEIVIFETEDKAITLPVAVGNETVWLNRNQMAELFARDVKTIGKHINNACLLYTSFWMKSKKSWVFPLVR